MTSILARAPAAVIISTKGTGTKKVNDVLLKIMTEEILKTGKLDWDVIWEKPELFWGMILTLKNM